MVSALKTVTLLYYLRIVARSTGSNLLLISVAACPGCSTCVVGIHPGQRGLQRPAAAQPVPSPQPSKDTQHGRKKLHHTCTIHHRRKAATHRALHVCTSRLFQLTVCCALLASITRLMFVFSWLRLLAPSTNSTAMQLPLSLKKADYPPDRPPPSHLCLDTLPLSL